MYFKVIFYNSLLTPPPTPTSSVTYFSTHVGWEMKLIFWDVDEVILSITKNQHPMLGNDPGNLLDRFPDKAQDQTPMYGHGAIFWSTKNPHVQSMSNLNKLHPEK